MIANNAASLDGRLRTLVVGVEDALGDAALNHRKTSTVLFQNRRWLDKFTIPGQYITITDEASGKSVRKPVSVSPYHARTTAGPWHGVHRHSVSAV